MFNPLVHYNDILRGLNEDTKLEIDKCIDEQIIGKGYNDVDVYLWFVDNRELVLELMLECKEKESPEKN